MERILGWDVGIKHLAYCIINKEGNNFKVEKWAIIDLTESDQHRCCGILKKDNSICDAGACFYGISGNDTKYYCGTHKSQHIVDLDALVKPCNENEQCKFISPRSKKGCDKSGECIINGNICCKKHKETLLKEKNKELSIKTIKVKKCTSADPQYLCERMYKKLNEIEDFANVDRVYIENQPTFINPTMKAVSSMLLSYFVYLFASKKLSNKIVKFVSPSFKILLNDDLVQCINTKLTEHQKVKQETCKCRLCILGKELITNKDKPYEKYKFSYDSVKELGIIYTEKILSDNKINDNFNLIKNYSKKDDLCDAFLHAYKKLNE